MAGSRTYGRHTKSAVELADMIRTQLSEPELRVAVYPDASGWHAKVYADPRVARDLQNRVDQAVRKLSARYDLEA